MLLTYVHLFSSGYSTLLLRSVVLNKLTQFDNGILRRSRYFSFHRTCALVVYCLGVRPKSVGLLLATLPFTLDAILMLTMTTMMTVNAHTATGCRRNESVQWWQFKHVSTSATAIFGDNDVQAIDTVGYPLGTTTSLASIRVSYATQLSNALLLNGDLHWLQTEPKSAIIWTSADVRSVEFYRNKRCWCR